MNAGSVGSGVRGRGGAQGWGWVGGAPWTVRLNAVGGEHHVAAADGVLAAVLVEERKVGEDARVRRVGRRRALRRAHAQRQALPSNADACQAHPYSATISIPERAVAPIRNPNKPQTRLAGRARHLVQRLGLVEVEADALLELREPGERLRRRGRRGLSAQCAGGPWVERRGGVQWGGGSGVGRAPWRCPRRERAPSQTAARRRCSRSAA